MRIKALALAVSSAVALTLASAGSAGATGTPASGSLVITEPNSFLQSSASAGVLIIPLPNASASYNSTTGASASFPVTGGTGSLPRFFGNIQLGGGILVVDCATHKAVQFNNVNFSIDNYYLTGVDAATGTTVPLVDVGDNTVVSNPAAVPPQTLTSNANIDATGGSYLDNALHTTFFGTDGTQVLGSLNITFTPAS
jgi:hypothetical protein